MTTDTSKYFLIIRLPIHGSQSDSNMTVNSIWKAVEWDLIIINFIPSFSQLVVFIIIIIFHKKTSCCHRGWLVLQWHSFTWFGDKEEMVSSILDDV